MFRSSMTDTTKVIFMLKYSEKLRRYINYVMWQRVVERHAALRHAATSRNLYKVVILPSTLT